MDFNGAVRLFFQTIGTVPATIIFFIPFLIAGFIIYCLCLIKIDQELTILPIILPIIAIIVVLYHYDWDFKVLYLWVPYFVRIVFKPLTLFYLGCITFALMVFVILLEVFVFLYDIIFNRQ